MRNGKKVNTVKADAVKADAVKADAVKADAVKADAVEYTSTGAALESMKTILAEITAAEKAANDAKKQLTTAQLQKCAACILNAARCFSKSPLKFHAVVAGALALINGCKATKRYSNNLLDYLTESAGIERTEDGFSLASGEALNAACQSYKDVALKDYKSKARREAEEKEKAFKKECKAAFNAATAKGQACMLILSALNTFRDKETKEDTAAKKADVIRYLQYAVAYIEQYSEGETLKGKVVKS